MTKQIQSLPSVWVKWWCGDNSLPTNCQNHHICYVKHRGSYKTAMHFFWVILFCIDVFMFSRMSRSLSNLARFSRVSDEFEQRLVCLDTQPLTLITKHNIWEWFLHSFKCLWADAFCYLYYDFAIFTMILCLAEFLFLHLALVIFLNQNKPAVENYCANKYLLFLCFLQGWQIIFWTPRA